MIDETTRPSLGFIYLTPSDVFIPRVDRQCIMRFCEAMAGRGLGVEVVSLNVHLTYEEPTRVRELFDVYGIKRCFKLKVLPNWTRQGGAERINPLWRLIVYSSYTGWKLLAKREAFKVDCTILYFKNYLLAIPLLLGRKVLRRRLLLLFEIHVPPRRPFARRLLKHVDGVIPISRILADRLQSELDLDPARVLVAHQGVNLDAVEATRVDKEEARKLLGLPLDKQLVVYTGKVHDWSGEIDLLLKCVTRMPEEVEMVIVGGREDYVTRLRQRAGREQISNVTFTGFVAPADVFRYQMAADVLVSYYPSGIELNDYRSPGKLFEYMAAKRPIVTADYPSLHEVLSPGAAVFVVKDNPGELARAVMSVLKDEGLAQRLSCQAYEDVQSYTWNARARLVHEFSLRLLGFDKDLDLTTRRA